MTEVIEDVVLKLESQDRIEPGQSRAGVLERRSEGEFEFDAIRISAPIRKWIPKKIDVKNRIRVTRHSETGDWHILVTVNKDQAQTMNINDVMNLENAISDALSYVRNGTPSRPPLGGCGMGTRIKKVL